MDTTSVRILTDDVVEHDSTYQELVNQLFITLDIKDADHAETRFPGLLNILSVIYYNVRTRVGCNENNDLEDDMYSLIPTEVKRAFSENGFTLEKHGCDRDVSMRLLVAVSKRRNISWETVGDKSQGWLLNALKRLDYTVNVVYVGAPLSDLQKRITGRVQTSLSKLTSKYQQGVRLADTNLTDRLQRIISNMNEIERLADGTTYYDNTKEHTKIEKSAYIALLRR
tara:strand:- start:93 stop:770 length:678 start_codon:yes stop_codon:yes gene_type:complete